MNATVCICMIVRYYEYRNYHCCYYHYYHYHTHHHYYYHYHHYYYYHHYFVTDRGRSRDLRSVAQNTRVLYARLSSEPQFPQL